MIRIAKFVSLGLWVALACASLCARGHEGDQHVTDGYLHRLRGGTAERQAVDDGANDHATLHEGSDGAGHVLMTAAKPVYPQAARNVVQATM